MRYEPSAHRLCVVTDARLSRGRSHVEIARRAVGAGARLVQLRDKEADDAALLAVAREIRTITREAGALLIVNDRPAVAAAAGADGVHVGREDAAPGAARAIVGHGAILGVSAGSVEEAIAAERAGADYLGVGPVFEARGTKPDAALPVGLETVRAVRAATRVPILAIGGIDAGNVRAVLEAGADGVAVVSAVVAADRIEDAVAGLLQALERAR